MLEVKRKPASHSHGAAGAAPARSYQDATKADDQRRQPRSNAAVREPKDFNGKRPVITGECHFKGSMSVDGLVSGQIGAQSSVSIKQKPSPDLNLHAELAGEFNFKGIVRVNGYIAGSVYSQTGTIIVDTDAKVEANVDVAVAVIGGTVNGDIVARERVELGPASRIYGNIWTRSIIIKDGAIFEGVCRMIDEVEKGVNQQDQA